MPTKTCAVLVKATAADDSTLKEGQFIALASVFNNIDSVGDVVMPGAFADDLKAWEESGDPIPLLWGHQMSDPNMNIGHVLEAKETDVGLQIKAELDVENNTYAMQVYRLLKGKRVRKMSFAYDIEDGAPGERDGQSVYELRKLKVHEVSVVQIPANPAATIQDVKAAADRRAAHLKNAATNPQLVPLLTQLLGLLAPVDTTGGVPAITDSVDAPKTGAPDTTSNDGKANPDQPATAEEPSGVKTDSPALPGPASLRQRIGLELSLADVD